MFLRAPKFWYKRPPVDKNIRRILGPFSKIYGFFAERNYRKDYNYKSEQAHVVAVGGITVGGSGKTPVVASMCEVLSAINKKVAILSRGFGRNSKKTLKVDNEIHTFTDVGDEPLMLSKYADVFVGDDHVHSVRMAEEYGHNLIILDDGLVQRDLQPDAKIVVVDSTQGFGNGNLLPLGPNRLSLDMIKDDIDALAIIKAHKDENIDEIKSQIPSNILQIVGYWNEDFSVLDHHDKFFAFCGIGYPQKFFNSLNKKLNVIETREFPDHHPFSDDDIIDLLDEARLRDAKLITTEKDFCRIPRRYHNFIAVAPIKVVWNDTAKIAQYLNLQG